MGKTVRGQRDGSGPYAGSYRKKVQRKAIGRRRAAGVKCPVKKK